MHRFHTSSHLSSSRQERKYHSITSHFHPSCYGTHLDFAMCARHHGLYDFNIAAHTSQYEISSVVVSHPLQPVHRLSSHSFKGYPRTHLPTSMVAFSSQYIRLAAVPTTTTTNTGRHRCHPHRLRSSLQIPQSPRQVVFQREIASHQRIRAAGSYKSLQSFQKSPCWQDVTNCH